MSPTVDAVEMDHAFSVRSALGHEMTTVAALFRAYASSLGVDLSYQGFEAELAGLPGAYEAPQGALLLAIGRDDEAIGCVAVRAMRDSGVCEMKRLYATPAARGLGVGRALALAAIDAATRAGFTTMRLDTLPDMAAAQALYRSLGFVVTQAYYDTPVAGTMFMSRRLG